MKSNITKMHGQQHIKKLYRSITYAPWFLDVKPSANCATLIKIWCLYLFVYKGFRRTELETGRHNRLNIAVRVCLTNVRECMIGSY